VTFIFISLHNPRRKSTKCATLSGLVNRSAYCRASKVNTTILFGKEHELGIEHPLVCPEERNPSIYITNDTPLNSHLPTFQLDATAVWRMNYYM